LQGSALWAVAMWSGAIVYFCSCTW